MENDSMHNGTNNGLQAVPANNAITAQNDAALYESLALKGDLSALAPAQKVAYYRSLCERLKLDPATQPFLPLKLNGKEILYASKACTDQLARVHNVTRTVVDRQMLADAAVYVVVVRAEIPGGRTEDSTGAVPISGKGEGFANALMKAETKAKRRATLSILGLGMLDETEIESIPETAKAPAIGFNINAVQETRHAANNATGHGSEPDHAPEKPSIPEVLGEKGEVIKQIADAASECNELMSESEPKWTKTLLLNLAAVRFGEGELEGVQGLPDMSLKALLQVRDYLRDDVKSRKETAVAKLAETASEFNGPAAA
jgi:hypothetical protein